MVRHLFYTIGDLTYQSPLVIVIRLETDTRHVNRMLVYAFSGPFSTYHI